MVDKKVNLKVADLFDGINCIFRDVYSNSGRLFTNYTDII